MHYFELTVIDSVEPNQPWTNRHLDRLEAKFLKNWMTMEYNRGMNIRDKTKRNRKTMN